MAKNTKHHDAVKYTNAQFQWGTKSGKEYLDLEPRLTMLSEQSLYMEKVLLATGLSKEELDQ